MFVFLAGFIVGIIVNMGIGALLLAYDERRESSAQAAVRSTALDKYRERQRTEVEQVRKEIAAELYRLRREIDRDIGRL